MAESQTAQSSTDAKNSNETIQVVVFNLADEKYAVPVLDVQEIIPRGDITPVPNVPDYIEGIINVRGTVATVMNLSKRFALKRDGSGSYDRYVVLTKVANSLFGMMVDEVSSVMKIPTSDIRQSHSSLASVSHKDFVAGVAVVDEKVILMLDFKKLVDGEQDLSHSS